MLVKTTGIDNVCFYVKFSGMEDFKIIESKNDKKYVICDSDLLRNVYLNVRFSLKINPEIIDFFLRDIRGGQKTVDSLTVNLR